MREFKHDMPAPLGEWGMLSHNNKMESCSQERSYDATECMPG
jgi:hypothetical protein